MSLSPNTNNKTKVLRTLLLFFGVFCMSTAIIMIKASTEQPLLVASYRLLVAALVLSPFFFRDLRTYRASYGWKQLKSSVVPAVILAVNFIAWVIGARMTQVASASLISNLTPVAMPFFLYAFYKEKITHREVVGTIFTLAGLVVLSGSSLSLSKTNFFGDLICLLSMFTFVTYMAIGRKNSSQMTLWLYLVPLYFIAGLICLICSLPFINPIKAYTLPNILYMLGLGLIPTVFGHTILNYSMKYIRGQVVSVTNLSQPIFSSILGFFIFGERPQAVLYFSAAFILVGILIVLSSGHSNRNQPAAAPVPISDAVNPK
ncbi:MAG: DMT family transporter [Anaerolineaceae bacterium]|nr:DMT family transporter [Anaerolineaceae bacterium]